MWNPPQLPGYDAAMVAALDPRVQQGAFWATPTGFASRGPMNPQHALLAALYNAGAGNPDAEAALARLRAGARSAPTPPPAAPSAAPAPVTTARTTPAAGRPNPGISQAARTTMAGIGLPPRERVGSGLPAERALMDPTSPEQVLTENLLQPMRGPRVAPPIDVAARRRALGLDSGPANMTPPLTVRENPWLVIGPPGSGRRGEGVQDPGAVFREFDWVDMLPESMGIRRIQPPGPRVMQPSIETDLAQRVAARVVEEALRAAAKGRKAQSEGRWEKIGLALGAKGRK